MKIKSQLFAVTGCALLAFASCQKPQDQIIGKWQFDSFESPAMDSMVEERMKSIDTMSKVDSEMAALLGTNDLDEIKSVLKDQMGGYKQQQEEAATMSSVRFLKGGEAIFYAGPRQDTSRWEMITKEQLVLSPNNDAQVQAGAKPDTAIIETLNKDKIRLKIPQGSSFIYINLRPFTKEDSLKANELIQKQQQMMEQQMQQMQQMQQGQGR